MGGKAVVVLEVIHVIIGKWRWGVLNLDLAVDNLCLKTVQTLAGDPGLEVSDLGTDGVGRRIKDCCGSHGIQIASLEACNGKVVY